MSQLARHQQWKHFKKKNLKRLSSLHKSLSKLTENMSSQMSFFSTIIKWGKVNLLFWKKEKSENRNQKRDGLIQTQTKNENIQLYGIYFFYNLIFLCLPKKKIEKRKKKMKKHSKYSLSQHI